MFSKREEEILHIIGRKKVTIDEIAAELFHKNEFDKKIKISNSIRRIIQKCDHFDLAFTLEKKFKNRELIIHRRKLQ